MIVLDPENVGCGRKVPPADLVPMQVAFERETGLADARMDYGTLVLPSGENWVTSIDRTVRFCGSDDVFVAAALAHAGNDVLCGRAIPDFMSVSIGIARREFESDGGVGLVSTLGRRMQGMGLRVGKLHTFIDHETNLTVSIGGSTTFGAPDCFGHQGSVYLTKPVGGLKAIYLSEIGHRVADLEAAVVNIQRWDGSLIGRLSPYVSAMTDVSGFGLGHALEQLMRARAVRGEIYTQSVPVVTPAVESVPVDCLDRGRGTEFKHLSLVGPTESGIALLSEVNGPLALLVSDENKERVREVGGLAELHEIGNWRKL